MVMIFAPVSSARGGAWLGAMAAWAFCIPCLLSGFADGQKAAGRTACRADWVGWVGWPGGGVVGDGRHRAGRVLASAMTAMMMLPVSSMRKPGPAPTALSSAT